MARLLVIGIGLGLLGTLAASRVLAGFLFGVTALDVRVTALTVALVSVAGSRRRADSGPPSRANVDPMLLLRS